MYPYTCCCETGCIGYTTKGLSNRTREYQPPRLSSRTIGIAWGAVYYHLVESHHAFGMISAFHTFHKVRSRQSRSVKCHILNTTGAVHIRLYNPSICAQKQFGPTSKLFWSDAYSVACAKPEHFWRRPISHIHTELEVNHANRRPFILFTITSLI